MNEKEQRIFDALRAWTQERLGRRAAAAPVAPTRAPRAPLPAASAEESASAARALSDLARTYAACTRCGLAAGRKNIVFGQGAPRATLLIVGEAPGAKEDEEGLAFVGRSGQLLTKMLAAIDLDRERDCYITNLVKCRPPENRNPLPAEMDSCDPILSAQIAILRPRAVLTLGNFATKRVLGVEEGITRVRGRVLRYKGVPALATFHPAFLLRDPHKKKEAWEDLKRLRRLLDGEETPEAVEAEASAPLVAPPAPRALPLFKE